MTKALRNIKNYKVDEVAAARIMNNHEKPGIGTLAAMDYMDKVVYKSAGGVRAKASSSKTRRERHIQEAQATRQQLIDAGIIKPVA